MTTITSDPVVQLKLTHRATWAAGDYPAVARHIADRPVRHALVAAHVRPGARVLDVATGSGNVALLAAKERARVVGLDLVPELLEVASSRAAAEGLDIEWVEGDAEALPFADGSFDSVTSVFGVQFAPRHLLTADEMARVCRPGGTIGLVNWTPDGLIGEMFGIMARYLPPPPAFASAPPLWGDERHVRDLFAHRDVTLTFTRASNLFAFESVDAYQTFFEQHYGPTIKAQEKLAPQGRWADCRAELRELFERRNTATDGSCRIEAEYVAISITRGHA
ncbi:MAG TPA: methyltransferase domain-containing protein [Solirubrobacteraceae bacterium]|nr:methyltransferase domain-containing protein [Solirubrobacteraceae bacterium]